MGDFQQKPNTGSLFKNDRKEKDTHPDYTGTINLGGKSMRLSAWIKEGKKGKWMSLSVSEQRAREDDPDRPPF